MDLVRIDPSDFHNLLDLCYDEGAGTRHQRIEVAGGLGILEVARLVGPLRLDESNVPRQRQLEEEDVVPDRDLLLAVGNLSAQSGPRQYSTQAVPRRADTFREGTLRHEDHLGFT